MFEDEKRDPSELEELRIKALMKDPQFLSEQLEHYKRNSQTGQVAGLLNERKDLKRRIASAHEALEAERTKSSRLDLEVKQLRRQLEALRKSKTMRAGRMVALPVKTARQLAKDPKAFGKSAVNDLKGSAKRLRSKLIQSPPAAKPEPRSAATPSRQAAPSAASERTPLSRSKISVEKELNSLWFQKGSISESARLIRERGEALDSASDKTKNLIERILGDERIRENGLFIPARSSLPAYVAEAKRVMYCVNQSPTFNSNGYSVRTRGIVSGIASAGWDVVVASRAGYPWDSKVDGSKPKANKRHVGLLDGIQYAHLPLSLIHI